jgi:hypothetical protein
MSAATPAGLEAGAAASGAGGEEVESFKKFQALVLASRAESAVKDWDQKASLPSTIPPAFAFGFSLGTVLNDCCASCWFNFLFVFLERVQGLNGAQVGAVFLTGQLCDALSTPVIGTLADRALGLYVCGLGRRHLFYLFGVIIVSLSFVFVFAVCLPVSSCAGRWFSPVLLLCWQPTLALRPKASQHNSAHPPSLPPTPFIVSPVHCHARPRGEH